MKKDFPLLKKSKIVYLDNAATTQKPQVVINAIVKHYEETNANSHRGIYDLSIMATDNLEEARKTIANYINAKPDEVIFVKNATEGFNMIAKAIENEVGRWHHVLVTQLEHHSNYVPWQQLAKKKQAVFEEVKYDKKSHKLQDIPSQITPKTIIAAFSAMSNATGLINDVELINKKIKEKNPKVFTIIDATQLIAHKKINVKQINPDFLVFSGHKMYGPLGVGVVYIKKELQEKINPFLYGGNMIHEVKKANSSWADSPEKFEAGTLDIASIVGLSTAINYLENNDEEKLFAKEEELKNYALEELRKMKHVEIIGHNSDNYGPIISLKIIDIHPHDLAEIANKNGVCIRAGHHCTQPLMRALDEVATARISLSFYNDKKDIDKFVDSIKKARKIING